MDLNKLINSFNENKQLLYVILIVSSLFIIVIYLLNRPIPPGEVFISTINNSRDLSGNEKCDGCMVLSETSMGWIVKGVCGPYSICVEELDNQTGLNKTICEYKEPNPSYLVSCACPGRHGTYIAIEGTIFKCQGNCSIIKEICTNDGDYIPYWKRDEEFIKICDKDQVCQDEVPNVNGAFCIDIEGSDICA